MPNYDFVNKDSGDVETHFMSWKELDKFKEDNPHLERLITAPASGLGSGGVKPGGGLDEVFAKAAEAHPDSPLADRYGKKSIKEIKTQEVVNKHRKKWSKE
jgi:hypothetical protein